MTNYYIEVELCGSAWEEKVRGDECLYEGDAACTQMVQIWLDAESAEDAEKFALRYDYGSHPDCEIEEHLEVYDVRVEESGEPVGEPMTIEFLEMEFEEYERD